MNTIVMSNTKRTHGRIVCRIMLACFFLLGVARPQAAFTSYDVEAAYLYNFGKFVRWPADANAPATPFSICILGEDPFGETLVSLVAHENMQGRPIAVRHLPSAASASGCQIVFLGKNEEPRLSKDLAELQKKPVLTASNLPGFLEHGGMIQFLQISNKVRFAVNLANTQQAGLTPSSDLLKVAVAVDSKSTMEVKP